MNCLNKLATVYSISILEAVKNLKKNTFASQDDIEQSIK